MGNWPVVGKGQSCQSCPIVHFVYMLSSSPGSSGHVYMPYVAIALQVQKSPQSSQSSAMAVYEIRQRRDMHQTYKSRAIDVTPFPWPTMNIYTISSKIPPCALPRRRQLGHYAFRKLACLRKRRPLSLGLLVISFNGEFSILVIPWRTVGEPYACPGSVECSDSRLAVLVGNRLAFECCQRPIHIPGRVAL